MDEQLSASYEFHQEVYPLRILKSVVKAHKLWRLYRLQYLLLLFDHFYLFLRIQVLLFDHFHRVDFVRTYVLDRVYFRGLALAQHFL